MRIVSPSSSSWKRADLALVRAHRLAGLERDHHVVQRAGHRSAMHDALAQRTPFMRAAILEREDMVLGGAEDGDSAGRRDDASRALPRNVGEFSDDDKGHGSYSAACAKPMVAIGLNSCLSLPETRSDHGSTCANFWL